MLFAIFDAENAYVETPTLPSQVEKYLCYLVLIKSKIFSNLKFTRQLYNFTIYFHHLSIY